MDSGTVDSSPLSATEIFERDCPFMLSLGMSYDLYWYGDPLAARSFFELHKRKNEEAHTTAWLQGLYMAYAINASIGNRFRGNDEKPFDYPDKPLIDIQREEERLADEQKRKDNERLLARLYMENMVRAGKDWGKKK